MGGLLTSPHRRRRPVGLRAGGGDDSGAFLRSTQGECVMRHESCCREPKSSSSSSSSSSSPAAQRGERGSVWCGARYRTLSYAPGLVLLCCVRQSARDLS